MYKGKNSGHYTIYGLVGIEGSILWKKCLHSTVIVVVVKVEVVVVVVIVVVVAVVVVAVVEVHMCNEILSHASLT
jgi:uncharacterized membrane protein